jgi:hypothetical protein
MNVLLWFKRIRNQHQILRFLRYPYGLSTHIKINLAQISTFYQTFKPNAHEASISFLRGSVLSRKDQNRCTPMDNLSLNSQIAEAHLQDQSGTSLRFKPRASWQTVLWIRIRMQHFMSMRIRIRITDPDADSGF